MLIDCDTCTARGTGCADCVVTVLLGAPPGWRSADPVVVPMAARTRPSGSAGAPGAPAAARATPAPDATVDATAAAGGPARSTTAGPTTAEDVVVPRPGVVVEFDEVEGRAVRALAAVGLVPPLRHRARSDDRPDGDARNGRRTG